MKYNLPEGWKEVRLGDIAEVSSSKRIYAKEYVESGVPFYRSKEIIEKSKGNDVSTELYITRERFNELKDKFGAPKKNDILLTSVGTLGVPYIVKDERFYFKDGNLTWIKGSQENYNSEFIYYWLLSDYGKHQIDSKSIGSTQKALTISNLKSFDIGLPTIQEQKAIANILSTLDDKIENNNKINKTVEEIAQQIFKHWFIDFEFPNEDGEPYKSSGGEMVESEMGMIPKGWEVKLLKDMANLTMGLSPKSTSYNFNRLGTPLLNGAADFQNGLINATKHTTEATRICKINDLVFCIRATIGNITFSDKEYCLGRGVASLTPKKANFIGLVYFNLLFSINTLIANAKGSVILGLSKPDINNIKVVLSDRNRLEIFYKIFNSIFKQIQINHLENQKLSNLRDTLLPKLMSGEIRVPLESEDDTI